MKKIIVISSMLLLVGFFAANAFAWCGGGWGHSKQASVNTGDYQSFYNDTNELRTSLTADRAELDALMAGSNPDSKRVSALAKKISNSESQLRNAAQKYNISGRGMGGHGMGMGMRGHGMGMHGYGSGWDCGITGHDHGFGGCW